MKTTAILLCILLLCGLLLGCGAAPEQTEPAPTTTQGPTYPVPDKLIALTFDDGPNAHMNTMLYVLEEYEAKATFFVIGKYVSNNSDIVSRAFEGGHEIGSHSYSHEDMTQKTDDEILEEIQKTQDLVTNITGTAPVWYRAPFFATNAQCYALIDMPFAAAGVTANDGSNDNIAADRHYKIVNNAYDGAIAILHCNDITAEVLPQILHDLKMNGYECVTISELFARKGVTPDTTIEFSYKDTNVQ